MPKLDNSPPRGTRDLLPEQVSRRESLVRQLVGTYESFGFRRIETPVLEDVARLTSGEGGENEKLLYRVLRRGLPQRLEESTAVDELADLGLRFDLTVPLTRFYANNQGRLPSPFRAMQVGPVFRAERPQKGRYRQFLQCDIDTLGEPSVIAEAELLEATVTALTAVGVGPVTVHLNDRRLLSAVAAACGVAPESVADYLVTLDKFDKVGWEGVRSELTERGFPESVGTGTERLVSLLVSAVDAKDFVRRAADAVPGPIDDVLAGLASTASALESLMSSLPGFSVSLDATIVRGLGYYTGQIFEVRHEAAAGSVAGGGRYDGLVGRSLGRDVPACGISIGFERIVDLAGSLTPDLGVAVVYESGAAITGTLAAARRIRATGRAATLVPRRSNFGAQLKELASAGYSGMLLAADDEGGEVRPLSSP